MPAPTRAFPGFRAYAVPLAAGLVLAACGGASGPGDSPAPADASAPAAPEASSPAVTAAADPVFPSRNRPEVRGAHGAVSAGHPLAAAAGYDVLRRGGTATDAAVAMAAVLAVVRPHMNGAGGDAFALFYDGATGQVTALNGSGRAGALATPAFFREAGHDAVPYQGPLSVSVPGAPAAWVEAWERYGSLSLEELLAPAVAYARHGFPVSERLAADFDAMGGDLNEPGRMLYLPGGSPPEPGSLLANPALARTLEAIAAEGSSGFYRGPVARALTDFLESRGGYLRAADLAEHASTWVEPLRIDYLDHTFLVLPPNTQGLAQIALMEMAKVLPLKGMGHNTSSYLHALVELKKLAFADRDRWLADPAHADIPLDRILEEEYLWKRVEDGFDPDRAARAVAPGVGADGAGAGGAAEPGDDAGDTVYLTAVDARGNAVSWIQSLYAGFGSGLLEPETGVVLQNRGALFTLEEGHPNQVAPGKRPYHTLTPTMALREGALAFTLGTPGGDGQTQSIVQIVNNLLMFGMSPQEAVEAPRFRSYGGLDVALEDRVAPEAVAGLEAKGHELRVIHGWTATFGGAQMIFVEPGSGTLTVASDPRREAYGIAY